MTQAGGSLWQQELEDATDLRVCHVFQDLESGRLWPFLAEKLPFADRSMCDEGHPVVYRGRTGKPREERPFVVLPDRGRGWTDPPDVAAILLASRQHARRRRALDEEDEADPEAIAADEGPEAEQEREGAHDACDHPDAITRVPLIEKRGLPLLLLTFACLPQGTGTADAGLQVCDPFMGQPIAREQVFESARRLRPLADRLRRLRDRSEETQRDEARRQDADRRQEAERWVKDRLGPGVHGSSLYERLVTVAQAVREQQQLDEAAPDFKRATPLAELRKTLGACRRWYAWNGARSWPMPVMAARSLRSDPADRSGNQTEGQRRPRHGARWRRGR